MTHAVEDKDEERRRSLAPQPLIVPLVSVIVVNYNYGRFLADAVSSVFNQTYKNVECIVVDNKSTDDSLTVLDELSQIYPSLQIVRRESNEGQCVATVEAFPMAHGHYIVFLDADDVLLPDFIGAHVFVHLSLYTHVGFSCSDMIQSVGREVVLSTFHSIKELADERAGQTGALLRPLPKSICPGQGLVGIAVEEVLPVRRDQRGWPWAATSAFMFRRDALALLMDNPRLLTLQTALDVYFARGINVITGSVVINRPLAVYRLHGTNIFSKHPHLERCYNFALGGDSDWNEQARRALIDFWFAEPGRMIAKTIDRNDFIEAVRTLSETYMPLRADGGRRSYAGAKLLAEFATIEEIVGLPTVLAWCLRLRLSPWAIAGAWMRSRR